MNTQKEKMRIWSDKKKFKQKLCQDTSAPAWLKAKEWKKEYTYSSSCFSCRREITPIWVEGLGWKGVTYANDTMRTRKPILNTNQNSWWKTQTPIHYHCLKWVLQEFCIPMYYLVSFCTLLYISVIVEKIFLISSWWYLIIYVLPSNDEKYETKYDFILVTRNLLCMWMLCSRGKTRSSREDAWRQYIFFLILQQNIISSSSSCASGVRTKELKSTVSNFKSPILYLFHSWTLHPFLALFRVLWCQRFWHTDQQRSKTRGFKECVLENMQTWLAMHEASNAIKNYSVWFWKVHNLFTF